MTQVVTRNARPVSAAGMVALALGATAIGAVAIGALAIGRVARPFGPPLASLGLRC